MCKKHAKSEDMKKWTKRGNFFGFFLFFPSAKQTRAHEMLFRVFLVSCVTHNAQMAFPPGHRKSRPEKSHEEPRCPGPSVVL